jgi:hypothetical protein
MKGCPSATDAVLLVPDTRGRGRKRQRAALALVGIPAVQRTVIAAAKKETKAAAHKVYASRGKPQITDDYRLWLAVDLFTDLRRGRTISSYVLAASQASS